MTLAERLVAEPRAAEGAWNFGPDSESECPVSEIAGFLVALWNGGVGGSAAWDHQGGDHPYEAGVLAVDSTKAKRHLDWSCRMPLERSLTATIAWYKAHLAGEDMAAVSLACIEDFTDGD